MSVDLFGNSHAPDLTYARGVILRSTDHDFRKLQQAWSLIRERGPDSIYIFTGLEHSLPHSNSWSHLWMRASLSETGRK